MKTCPFTQKQCSNDCQLFMFGTGKCAIAIIAESQCRIVKSTNSIENSQQGATAAIRQISQKR